MTLGYAVAVLSVFTEFVRVPDDAEEGQPRGWAGSAC